MYVCVDGVPVQVMSGRKLRRCQGRTAVDLLPVPWRAKYGVYGVQTPEKVFYV